MNLKSIQGMKQKNNFILFLKLIYNLEKYVLLYAYVMRAIRKLFKRKIKG